MSRLSIWRRATTGPTHGRGDGSDGYASLGALSPDARFVAVDWYNERDGSLRIVGTDGTAPRVLVDPPGDVSAYQWSRDGSMILAALGRENGRARRWWLLAMAASASCVSWFGGPESRSALRGWPLCRVRLSGEDGATDHDLYVLDAHTVEQWPLDVSPGHDISPFWTPDGRAVVFLSDRNRNPSLWRVPVENGRPRAPRVSSRTISGESCYVV